jgi:hypothetical protein
VGQKVTLRSTQRGVPKFQISATDTTIGSIIKSDIVEPIGFRPRIWWEAAVVRRSDNCAWFLPKSRDRDQYPYSISGLESSHCQSSPSHDYAFIWPK